MLATVDLPIAMEPVRPATIMTTPSYVLTDAISPLSKCLVVFTVVAPGYRPVSRQNNLLIRRLWMFAREVNLIITKARPGS